MPLHTRALSIAVSRESDSLWYARGDIIDLRKNGFVPSSYDIHPSAIIHSMNIELRFDPESLRIEHIAVDQPFIAIDPSEATNGECCRDPAPRLLDFEGDALDADFTKRLGAHFGGALGCSHLLTLFQLMASTIPRAVDQENERRAREGNEARLGEKFFRRSVFIDGHLRDDNRIDVAVQLADTHSRPLPPNQPFTKRLESSHEWKILTTIERKRFHIESISAAERERTFETLASAEWISHNDVIAPLAQAPIIPGLAGRIFRIFPAESPLQPLRDTFLQLAPGFIQVVAALMDDYFKERARVEGGGEAPRSEVASLGGNTDSCYMWRQGSPINISWTREDTAADSR
jgi:hypothetical protein